jgi:hypothetical protein
MAVIELHFDTCRHLYMAGSGDGLFYLVEAAIRRTLDAKHPSRDRDDDEPVRLRPRPSGRIREIRTVAGGPPDLLVEGRAARLLRDSERNVERPSGLPGYEKAGDPIGLEDD